MSLTLDLIQGPLKNQLGVDNPKTRLPSLEGKVQRVKYQKRELTVVAEGRLWAFTLAEDCQLWFQGRQVPFRCFHPLDHIRIFYESQETRLVAHALYVWEFFP